MSGIMVVLLGVLWIAGSATAHPPSDTPPESGEVRVAGVTAPLLHYQGRLTDPGTGEPVADGSHTMTFRLYDTESGGTELWTETEDVSVQGGVFSTILGDKEPLDQGWFDGRELWLGVKVGADVEATPRQRILPVAYALSLVPGAVISTTSDAPALELINARSGATLVVTNTVQDGIQASGGSGDWAAGVVGYNYSDAHGMGVQGWSKADSGESYGVWGFTHSPEGAGVKGIGQGGSHGVYGETGDTAGGYDNAGVYGRSTHTETFGVVGVSEYGRGVEGRTGALDNFEPAVQGWNAGGGPGIVGFSQSNDGVQGYSEISHGVYGETGDTAGGYDNAGVYGRSTHTETFGVVGVSEYGRGVEGRTWALDNFEPAVQGWNAGGGPGIVGFSQSNDGVQGYSESSHGVYGETHNTAGGYDYAGVYGRSTHTETFGVLGESEYGVAVIGRIGELDNTHSAVAGQHFGGGAGVSGWSQNSFGVDGYSEDSHGVYGETYAGGFYEFAGVKGHSTYSDTFGVLGTSDYGIGVEGHITELANTNSAVVGWNSGGGIGVEGYSENNAGVYGSGASYGGHFVSAGGKALRADGDVEVNGDLEVSGKVIGGEGTTLPIAYGFINADGSLASGSHNVSSYWFDKGAGYGVSISEYSYSNSEYITLVTLSAADRYCPCIAQTDSIEGDLLIYITDPTGEPVQTSFQFVTYKPLASR
jgi:hypothetical protein